MPAGVYRSSARADASARIRFCLPQEFIGTVGAICGSIVVLLHSCRCDGSLDARVFGHPGLNARW